MSTNVCKNQQTFNGAFQNALNNYYYNQPQMPIGITILYFLLFILFIVWALYLAMKVKMSPERIIHIIFAIIVSPLYIISYYLNNL